MLNFWALLHLPDVGHIVAFQTVVFLTHVLGLIVSMVLFLLVLGSENEVLCYYSKYSSFCGCRDITCSSQILH